MRYHGNYCGPNWSAGKYQPSVVSDVLAVDEFDETCQAHDAKYALKDDLSQADHQFYLSNIGKGLKRSVAAVLVKAQQLARDSTRDKIIDKNKNKPNQTTTMANIKNKNVPRTKLRGNVTQSKNGQARPQVSTVPAAYGYTLKMTKPKVARNGDHAVITGSDYAGSVYAANSNNFEPASSVIINPAFFQNAMLGSMSRAYEKYRVKSGYIEYVPAVPTSQQGQIVMLSTSTIKEPFIPGTTTTFLSRALSQGHALATPIWKSAVMDLTPDEQWNVVDCLIDSDLDDCISQEVQVYATCDATVTAGILLNHYELEFRDPLYTFHPTLIPNPVGNGSIINMTDNSNANAITDNIVLNNFSISLSAAGDGAVYRLVFQQAISTLPTGPATWADAARSLTAISATTTSNTQNFTNITLNAGTTLYGVNNGGSMTLYTSLEGAINGWHNHALYYQTATTIAGVWHFLIDLVRIGSSLNITTQ